MLQPVEYADAVSAHAKLGNQDSLYPGLNFANLASFLHQPFTQGTYTPRHDRTENTIDVFEFARNYSFSSHVEDRMEVFRSPAEMKLAVAVPKPGEKTHSILFLRGLPSPMWLSTIGGIYKVDPEFFQRHLDFWSAIGRINYFPLPSLPSTSGKMIELTYISIGQREASGRTHRPREINSMRQASLKTMGRYIHEISTHMETGAVPGNSMVRSFDVLDETHFVIEQRISIYMDQNVHNRTSTASRCKHKMILLTSCTALIWLDTGRNLAHGPAGPWVDFSDRRGINQSVFYPTIQILPSVALKSHLLSVNTTAAEPSEPSSPFAQSSALLASEYGKTLDKKLIVTEQFYALHELFLFCAFSHSQYLNIIESKLDNETDFHVSSDQIEDHSNILYRQRMLETHANHFRTTIAVIRAFGGLSKSEQIEDGETADSVPRRAAKSLLTDYQHLLSRNERLSTQCQAQMALLMNRAMIAESTKAIQQAKEVTKLTRLAFVFVPLSFTASVCGMNLWPFIDGGPSLWVWFALSAPFLLLSFLVMLFDVRALWTNVLAGKRKDL